MELTLHKKISHSSSTVLNQVNTHWKKNMYVYSMRLEQEEFTSLRLNRLPVTGSNSFRFTFLLATPVFAFLPQCFVLRDSIRCFSIYADECVCLFALCSVWCCCHWCCMSTEARAAREDTDTRVSRSVEMGSTTGLNAATAESTAVAATAARTKRRNGCVRRALPVGNVRLLRFIVFSAYIPIASTLCLSQPRCEAKRSDDSSFGMPLHARKTRGGRKARAHHRAKRMPHMIYSVEMSRDGSPRRRQSACWLKFTFCSVRGENEWKLRIWFCCFFLLLLQLAVCRRWCRRMVDYLHKYKCRRQDW